MSRNGSGTYTLPAGNPVVTGTTITSSWANTSLSDIASALTGSVAADGQTPMSGRLNMTNNIIENVADATAVGDAVSVNYYLINNPQKMLGFIAQDVETVLPGLIETSASTQYDLPDLKSIKTSVLIPMLVQAIQELKAEVDALKA